MRNGCQLFSIKSPLLTWRVSQRRGHKSCKHTLRYGRNPHFTTRLYHLQYLQNYGRLVLWESHVQTTVYQNPVGSYVFMHGPIKDLGNQTCGQPCWPNTLSRPAAVVDSLGKFHCNLASRMRSYGWRLELFPPKLPMVTTAMDVLSQLLSRQIFPTFGSSRECLTYWSNAVAQLAM